MGIIFGRLNQQNEVGRQSVRRIQQQANQLIEESDFSRWQKSGKTVEDLIIYLQSTQSQAQNHQKVKLFISSIVNRQKLTAYLQGLQNYLIGMNKPCQLDTLSQKQLLNFVHPKLANLWFVWNQINLSSVTPVQLHERMLYELQHNYDYAFKLQSLFNLGQMVESLPLQSALHYWDWEKIVEQAIRTNYPFLISKQTLCSLFRHIVEQHVFLSDTLYFINFIKNIYEQVGTSKGVQQCRDYIERLSVLLSEQQQNQMFKYLKQFEKNRQNQHILTLLIQAGRLFLDNGYPHAMQLIFQALNQFPQTHLKSNQILTFVHTKIYSLFMYNFEQINLQYQHLQKMPISSIIHLMLRDNNFSVLNKLQQILKIAQQFQKKNYNQQNAMKSSSFDFQHQISEYIFSNYCNLQMCLQVISGSQKYIQIGPNFPERQKKLVLKLNQYKFQVIILNQSLIQTLYQTLLRENNIFKQLTQKIEQILQIVRLFYMFGVNQKFSFVTVFYCPQAQILFDETRKDQIKIIEQQKALHLFKNFVSKFYISGDRSKKILLNSKSGNQTAVDLSKPQAIFQISQYLFDKIFKKGLHSIKQIHQIIFQHMIYFYKYEEAKATLTNQSIINKFNINVQMLQIIAIENIVKTIKQSSDIKKDINDINFQLKLIKNNKSVQSQSAKAMVKLVTYLNQNGIQLSLDQKDKMDTSLLFKILNRYSDRIQVLNFDTIYQYIKTINSNEIIDNQQKLLMTNELLRFKSKLAAKAFELGKRKLGNQVIDQISRFDPPWLTTQLIQIFKLSTSKIDRRVFGIALKSCSKGSDLKYLMALWKQQQGKQRRKQKGFSDITQYFQTGRQYLVIDDSLIKNEQSYRNYVAECQFSDQILHLKKYQLFFVLLGSEPERAFHYALIAELDPFKIDTFLKQAMKSGIISTIGCVPFMHKFLYFVNQIQTKMLPIHNLPSFIKYTNTTFNPEYLIQEMKEKNKNKQKQLSSELYSKILSAYVCLQFIDQRFISTYFNNIPQKNTNVEYQILLNEKSRKNLLIDLRQQPMGKSDIIALNKLCNNILDLNFVDLCIFSLANLANTSQQMDEKCQNIIHKIITLTIDKQSQCKQIIIKLIQKIFSTTKLFSVLSYMKERENPLYQQIIKQKNLKILQLLGSVETGQQFHGLIPQNYFQSQIKYDPYWPLSNNHFKILKSCWKKTNILVLAKFMYFIYGMNTEIQKQILTNYLLENPDDELEQIKQKLEN